MAEMRLLLVALLACTLLQAQGRTQDKSCAAAAVPQRGAMLLQSPFQKIKPAASPALVVKLEKLGSTYLPGRNFFVGNLTVGYPPQQMRVVFDTGSGNVLLPHRACKSKACKAHRQYSSWNSQESVDINFNGSRLHKTQRHVRGKVLRDAAIVDYTSADIGSGRTQGAMISDLVCIAGKGGRKVCARPGIVAAISMDRVPFLAMPNDGIVGLGLTNSSMDPYCSFFGRLLENNKDMAPQFGLSFGPNGGELSIGGYDSNALKAPLQWFPVHSPEEGYWQVPIHAVRVGKTIVNSCEKGCHAIIDTGASRLGVQKALLPQLKESLTTIVHGDGSCLGPTLEFDLGGMSVKLGPEDYTESSCSPDLGTLDVEEPEFTGVYAFGERVLHNYFVVFDWKQKAMGFAPSRGAGAWPVEEQVFM